MKKFRLEIELGNAEMRTYSNIAEALQSIADHLDGQDTEATKGHEVIRDVNGNTVGEWKITRQSNR